MDIVKIDQMMQQSTMMGAFAATALMPAAVRLAFGGDTEGLAQLADRHGVAALSEQEPTTGVTPAWAAAHQNHAAIVALLDTRDALLSVRIPLSLFCWTTHDTLELSIERALPPPPFPSLRVCDAAVQVVTFDTAGATTPAFAAAHRGNTEVLQVLGKPPRGPPVDMERPNLEGATPLYAACREGHLSAVRFLARHGVGVDTQANDGASPLFVATANGQ